MSRAIAAAVGRPARPGGGASAQSRIAGIEVLPEYLEVLDQIRKGTPLILVTGGAGTGKSTFIRWLEERYRGEILLCAPTGIAALTIGGRTIHSLCKFPPAYILPSDIRPKEPRAKCESARHRRDLYGQLELAGRREPFPSEEQGRRKAFRRDHRGAGR